MDWTAIACAIATIGMMGAMFKWFSDRLDKRFDKIDERFDRIYNDLTAIRMDIRNIDGRLSRLEGQDEERFRAQLRDRMAVGNH